MRDPDMIASDEVSFLSLLSFEWLLLVEQVIREYNTLDSYAMIEGYYILLAERVDLIEREKVCHGELKEVMPSLIFVASWCGEFPELHEVLRCTASRYGREFADQAVAQERVFHKPQDMFLVT
ncbi:hypothetical protein MLD38_005490 [Melastoma candidum]|uniref:Uncharacterized protein n=1 Tax=Melastoma candidum TaxID=119954 RepID=A0ACB9RJ67_9MYRT|nr:hypothetical protein MLD38_005490 [Melastoma candidum]